MISKVSFQMNRSGKLSAALDTSRVANLPSVISNVWLGVAIGTIYEQGFPSSGNIVLWSVFLRLSVAGAMLYIAGNFLNDWADQEWDKEHRSERALPRGLFSSNSYAWVSALLTLSGIAMAWTVSRTSACAASVIVVCIGLYTYGHKRCLWAVIPMGLCRALLPLLGIFAFTNLLSSKCIHHGLLVLSICASLGIFCYIVGLTLAARYESTSEPPIWISLVARGLLLVTPILLAWGNKGLFIDQKLIIAGTLPYLLWTSLCLRFRRRPVKRFISGLLAGIPFVDWAILLPLALALSATSSGWGPFPILCTTIPPLAFLASLLLQRFTPAT